MTLPHCVHDVNCEETIPNRMQLVRNQVVDYQRLVIDNLHYLSLPAWIHAANHRWKDLEHNLPVTAERVTEACP